MLWNVMAILLLLLKIVGILLLILLFLLVLILFAPLRYRVCTSFYEEKQVRGRVSWLCFVLRAVFLREGEETRWKLRVFGIPIMSGGGDKPSSSEKNRRRKENKKRKAAKNKQNVVKQQKQAEKAEQIEKAGHAEQTESTGQAAEEMGKSVQKDSADDPSSETSRISGNKPAAKPGKHRGIIVRIREWWEKIKNFFHTLKEIFGLFREKARSLGDLADLLREEEARHSICIVKDNVIHLWKQIHPRKIRGDIVFGTGDPCTTGQALGGISLLYAWIGSGVHIVPDFQEKRFEGKLDVLGRIRIITLIVIIIKLMFHKDVKELWQKLEQWKEDF